ncbi:MAG: FCD domain-containing protein [Chloroflexi bacterium]|nr:FCD domain-containing protein [Chloroflexota bacterium]
MCAQVMSNEGHQLLFRLQRPETLPERVVEKFVSLIQDGTIAPGDRLPPERELGRMFGVGPSVMREALQVLASRGLICVHQGVVATVTTPDAWAIMDTSLLAIHPSLSYTPNIVEARSLIEKQAALLACERATEADIDAMWHWLLRCEASDDKDGRAFANLQFHLALVNAAHNPVITLLYEPLLTLLDTQLIRSADQEHLMAARLGHRRICEAVRRRDQAATRLELERHFEQALAGPDAPLVPAADTTGDQQ